MLDDNVNNQCLNNSKACLFTDDSFTKQIEKFYFVEEIYDVDG